MPNPYSPKPSLNDARARIARASKHIKDLEVGIQTALRSNVAGNTFVLIPAFTTGKFEDTTHTSSPVIAPPIISILIGEAVYNLRAALDYLVFELALLDARKIQKGTKFLIEDSIKAWNQHLPIHFTGPAKARKKLWLHKLTPSHQAMLKGLQPFSGCRWTKRLRDLSNPDKHHSLVWVGTQVTGAIVRINPSMRHFTIPSAAGLPVGVEAEITGHISFVDGSAVVETLNLFQKEVADIIDRFNRDFP